MNYELLEQIGNKYGESYYILNTERFKQNFIELQNEFRKIYPDTYIAYSYKTNYIPDLCKIVDELGGYAEIVSDMEYEITKRLNISADKIIFNGPYKNKEAITEILLRGGCVNIDSVEEFEYIKGIAKSNADKIINIGIRVNFAIENANISRFGIDIESDKLKKIVKESDIISNINIREFHCHYAPRNLENWKARTEKMLKYSDELFEKAPAHIDLGGGLFGKMKDDMKRQFSSYIPEYKEYAQLVATMFNKYYEEMADKPMLFIEPGTALVGDVMRFAAKIVGIKSIRGKYIATLLGSVYNINPTLNGKNPSLEVYHKEDDSLKYYEDLDFGGYTCIESDYLYRGYNGKLAIGDYVVFDNVGSYSIVLKPPFILPNFSVISYNGEDVKLVKRRENFEDIFRTYQMFN